MTVIIIGTEKSNAAWLLNGLAVTAAAAGFFSIDNLLQLSAKAEGVLNFMNSLWYHTLSTRICDVSVRVRVWLSVLGARLVWVKPRSVTRRGDHGTSKRSRLKLCVSSWHSVVGSNFRL
jgi:hypothetical protein